MMWNKLFNERNFVIALIVCYILGVMDISLTYIGIEHYGATEGNPFVARIIGDNKNYIGVLVGKVVSTSLFPAFYVAFRKNRYALEVWQSAVMLIDVVLLYIVAEWMFHLFL